MTTKTPPGPPIPTVRALHNLVTKFGRVPPAVRPARVEQIRQAAKTLGASDLTWVQSFLARQDGSVKPPGPRPLAQGRPNLGAIKP